MTAPTFAGRLGLQQRVLPAYRVAFFERLAAACEGGFSLYAGEPRPAEAILTARALEAGDWRRGRNVHLLGGLFYVCLQPGLLDWLEAWNPHALVLEANPRYLSNPGAARWMHARGRPVVGWGLGAAPARGALGPFRRWYRRLYLGRFDAVISYSSLGADQYVAAGMAPERVFVAPNAVAPPPLAPPEREPLAGRSPRLLYVGRLQARKRVDLLLRACARLGADPPAELWIVGDGPARPELERLAAAIYPAARFTGALLGEDLAARFREADLFVLPGTGGLAVQEAMSYALPVVVAEADGTRDDLVRPGNGWSVPPGDVGALAGALRAALSDPGRLRRMGAESHRVVSEEVNLEAMVAAFVAALEAVSRGR